MDFQMLSEWQERMKKNVSGFDLHMSDASSRSQETEAGSS